MKENTVKRALERGEVVVGTMMMEFATTGIARIAAAAGAQFAVFDMEHTGWSMETVRMLMATSRAADLVPLVRVPTLQYHFIARVLDVGAMGVMVPFVANADQARAIVASAKYPPEGRRGCAFTIAHDDYGGGDVAAKMAQANRDVMLIAQIESVEGLENVEAIAAVPGIDVLWIGQFDLTASMGIPGQFDHPRFHAATRSLLDACARTGKTAALGGMNVEQLRSGPAAGYRMIVHIADLWIYQDALARSMRALRGESQ